MNLRRPSAAAAALTLGLLGGVGSAAATTIFWEDFNGYSYSSDDPGIPQISEGADEFWYAGRFEQPDNGSINSDLAVQGFGGSDNPTPVGRFEDDAGILLRVPVGYTNLTLDFDWRTFLAESTDRLVVGYHVGDDLGFDTGANRFRDFYALEGGQSQVEQWWVDEWTEVLRASASNSFHHVSVALPDNVVVWVAFWLDNGEGDHGKLDNVHVQGTPIPEPSTGLLLTLGLGALGMVGRRGPRRG